MVRIFYIEGEQPLYLTDVTTNPSGKIISLTWGYAHNAKELTDADLLELASQDLLLRTFYFDHVGFGTDIGPGYLAMIRAKIEWDEGMDRVTAQHYERLANAEKNG